MFNGGCQKCPRLHGFVGCAGDVTGDPNQAVRAEARHHSGQIDLEPQLKVFRAECFVFRSNGLQRHVQDGVSHCCIWDEGDVFLEIKGFLF